MNILFGVFIIFTFFLLFISGILKSLSFDYFTFNTYEILNKKISKPIINISSIIFIFLELFIPLVSLLNFTIKKWQIILVAFSYLFTLLILLTAIYMGNKNKSCGCFGKNFKNNINWYKVIENLLFFLFLCTSLFFKVTTNYITLIIAAFLIFIYFISKYKRSF
ncbi:MULTISPECIES: MauE/DoxX family redox-associated membrane protein [Bacillati]|uniref:Methylamine utilisation protein MauE domain-containing protein n=1 Tax=Staphylococcus warneri TaxID=1292 RepID=A0A8B2ZHH6_STAWA|nr:hypothetical protein NS346_05960 [Staphylococcus warneri]KTW22856.1 hypothetical protein SA10R_06955 [Staphylococcus warneri]PAK71934.1 hypothetical protein B8W95_12230 [Staphylococcus pasteuri]PTI12243.1 hypothetical protein BU094_09180 [Staphylococcus warneri]RGM27595.1 hypothetical protein DXC19_12475 [Staphylococcus warneri]